MSEMSELFSRDPLLLTVEDRAEIVAKLRADRQRFMMGAKAEKAAPVPKVKGAKLTGLGLDDLGL